jgi:hypothetical protein
MSRDTDADTGSERPGITAEQLGRVVRRMETGFYERPEVREQIARRVLEDLRR